MKNHYFCICFPSQLKTSEDKYFDVRLSILQSFLSLLPLTVSSQSSGGINWYFMLLTGLLTSDDVETVGNSCIKLLDNIGQQLDNKLTYHDRILRAK